MASVTSSSVSWFQVGALSAGLSVALGAFGAHGLKSRVADPSLLKTWETAAHYHMIHSIGTCLRVDSFVHHRSRRPNHRRNLNQQTNLLHFSTLTKQRC